PSLDFLLLDEHFLLLRADVDLPLLDDQLLLPLCRLKLEGDLLVRALELHLGLRLLFDDVAVPVELRHVRLGARVRPLRLLGGLGLRNRRLAVRARLSHPRAALHLFSPLHAARVEVASSEEIFTWATALMLIFAPDRFTSVTMSVTTRSSVLTSSLNHSTDSKMGTMNFAPPDFTW